MSEAAPPTDAARAASPIRILIADDHLVFRMGLKTLIATEPDFQLAGEARTGRECIEMYPTVRPDVVVLDLRMPEGGGLAALEAIRHADPGARMLMLTSYGTEEDVFQAIRLGAMGYVLKDIAEDELAKAIRTVQAGGRCIPPEIAARLAERLPRQTLSMREMDILKLLIRGLTNKEMAEVLDLSVSTVKAQLNTIFTKLDVSDRTEAATAVLKRGILRLE